METPWPMPGCYPIMAPLTTRSQDGLWQQAEQAASTCRQQAEEKATTGHQAQEREPLRPLPAIPQKQSRHRAQAEQATTKCCQSDQAEVKATSTCNQSGQAEVKATSTCRQSTYNQSAQAEDKAATTCRQWPLDKAPATCQSSTAQAASTRVTSPAYLKGIDLSLLDDAEEQQSDQWWSQPCQLLEDLQVQRSSIQQERAQRLSQRSRGQQEHAQRLSQRSRVQQELAQRLTVLQLKARVALDNHQKFMEEVAGLREELQPYTDKPHIMPEELLDQTQNHLDALELEEVDEGAELVYDQYQHELTATDSDALSFSAQDVTVSTPAVQSAYTPPAPEVT